MSNGQDCPHCNEWGEMPTGKYKTEKQLCNVCWGSGEISQSRVSVWFLLRAVPTMLLLIGGCMGAWLLWQSFANVIVTALLIMITLSIWGGLMYTIIRQLPNFGELDPNTWFFWCAVPSSVFVLGMGTALLWILWSFVPESTVIVIAAFGVFIVWAMLIYYLMSDLPE